MQFFCYVTCRFLKIFSKCFFGQLLLSFIVLPLAFKYYFTCIHFARPSPFLLMYLLYSPVKPSHKTLRLHSFATKDLFQKTVSDISP